MSTHVKLTQWLKAALKTQKKWKWVGARMKVVAFHLCGPVSSIKLKPCVGRVF